MAENDSFIIRRMNRKDMDITTEWAINEKWNPGKSDADNFFNTDPEGFFIAELNGAPVSCVATVRYDDNFGFLGYYLAREGYKGKGYGLKVFRAGMEYLGSRNIGLDGVIQQEENYKKSGFKTAYYTLRYEGVLKGEDSHLISNIDTVPFEDLVEFDGRFFPAKRPKFLEGWIKQPNIGMVVKDKDTILGFSVIRPRQTGYRIGPLVSENEEIAGILMQAMAKYSNNEVIRLDVPEINLNALRLMEKLNLRTSGKTARMYTKSFPELQYDKIYAPASLALG